MKLQAASTMPAFSMAQKYVKSHGCPDHKHSLCAIGVEPSSDARGMQGGVLSAAAMVNL